MVEDIPSRENRNEDKVCGFDEYFDALRRIDQRISEAGEDASLKGFWLGLKREYQVEFDLLSQEGHRSSSVVRAGSERPSMVLDGAGKRVTST